MGNIVIEPTSPIEPATISVPEHETPSATAPLTRDTVPAPVASPYVASYIDAEKLAVEQQTDDNLIAKRRRKARLTLKIIGIVTITVGIVAGVGNFYLILLAPTAIVTVASMLYTVTALAAGIGLLYTKLWAYNPARVVLALCAASAFMSTVFASTSANSLLLILGFLLAAALGAAVAALSESDVKSLF